MICDSEHEKKSTGRDTPESDSLRILATMTNYGYTWTIEWYLAQNNKPPHP